MSTSNLPGPGKIKTVGELGANDTTALEQGVLLDEPFFWPAWVRVLLVRRRLCGDG